MLLGSVAVRLMAMGDSDTSAKVNVLLDRVNVNGQLSIEPASTCATSISAVPVVPSITTVLLAIQFALGGMKSC